MQTVAIPLTMVVILSFLLSSNPVLLAHTFSENENALFLTMINKIKAETQLVAHFSNNREQAQAHAKIAEGLFSQKDPVVNTTWTSEISERNPRVTADLLHSLNDLKTTIASPSSSSNPSSIQSKVTNIGNLLDEAVSVRISKNLIDNPKTQALVLANLGNDIYNNYGAALGLPPSTVASMGGISMPGMNMPSNGPMNMNMNTSSSGMSGMNAVSEPVAKNQSPATIKNLTAYQTAESLAVVVQQVFDKKLKPIAPANATNSNNNIANYLDQLKNAINNKSSFMNVMELVHVKLHPTLISAYNLGLSMPGINMKTSSGNGVSGMNAVSQSTSMDQSPATFDH